MYRVPKRRTEHYRLCQLSCQSQGVRFPEHILRFRFRKRRREFYRKSADKNGTSRTVLRLAFSVRNEGWNCQAMRAERKIYWNAERGYGKIFRITHLRWKIVLETERLYLCEMKQEDFQSLCRTLQDNETVYAGTFSNEEVREWLDRLISRYWEWNGINR